MIIFAHIPKTAGSSFHQWLEQACGKERTQWHTGPIETSPEPVLSNPETRSRYAVYGGHFQYKQFRPFLQPDDKVFAVVREPFARAASLLHQMAVQDPNHHLRHEVVGKSLVDAANSSRVFRSEITNQQCNYLSQHRNFDNARKVIDGYKPYIFTFERIDLLVARITACLGLTNPPVLKNLNASRVDHLARLSEDDINLLSELNAEDKKLYEWARANELSQS